MKMVVSVLLFMLSALSLLIGACGTLLQLAFAGEGGATLAEVLAWGAGTVVFTLSLFLAARWMKDWEGRS